MRTHAPKLRLFCALLALLTAGAVLSPAASAAPRIVSVDGVWLGENREAEYVVLDVRTRDATRVRVRWRGHGGAFQRVRAGRVGIGFANDRDRTFRISTRACVKRRCGRVQRFSGRFRPQPRNNEPPPNSQPNPGGGGGGQLPGLPELPGLPPLPGGLPGAPLPETPLPLPTS